MSLDYASPLHFCLQPGESTPSLVTRLAHATSPQWQAVLRELARGDHAVASTAIQTGLSGTIAELAGITEEDVLRGMLLPVRESATYVRLGDFTLLHHHVSQSDRRLAPSVLAADIAQGRDPYHRLIWSIAPLIADPSTGEILISHCDCGRALSWGNVSDVARCPHCAQKLWLMPSSIPSGVEFEIATFFCGLFNPDAHTRRRFRHQLPCAVRSWSEGDIIDLVDTLATFPFRVARSYPIPYPERADIRVLGVRDVLGGEAGICRTLTSTLNEAAPPEHRLVVAIALTTVLAAIDCSASPKTRSYLRRLVVYAK